LSFKNKTIKIMSKNQLKTIITFNCYCLIWSELFLSHQILIGKNWFFTHNIKSFSYRFFFFIHGVLYVDIKCRHIEAIAENQWAICRLLVNWDCLVVVVAFLFCCLISIQFRAVSNQHLNTTASEKNEGNLL
jgi:hypothetical protein